MELKQIKELMATMGRTGTKKLLLKKEGFEIEIEREDSGFYRHNDVALAALEYVEEPSFRPEALQRAHAALPKGRDLPSSLSGTAGTESSVHEPAAKHITSPMVGTFYAAPTPDDPPFVKVGDRVEKDTVVCIVEAMKVMNEVKAGIAGIVVETLIESGNPVEFGSKLFRIST